MEDFSINFSRNYNSTLPADFTSRIFDSGWLGFCQIKRQEGKQFFFSKW
jgi:hypothetical protein